MKAVITGIKKSSIGFVFPGQGSQFVGMGQEWAERFPTAREAFEEADSILGMALSELCWRGPEDSSLLEGIWFPYAINRRRLLVAALYRT